MEIKSIFESIFFTEIIARLYVIIYFLLLITLYKYLIINSLKNKLMKISLSP